MLGEPALPSFRLGHRKISDANRAVNGAQSRPEHGVITITITITIMIMIMIMITMRKHPHNLPTSATDRPRFAQTTIDSGHTPLKGVESCSGLWMIDLLDCHAYKKRK